VKKNFIDVAAITACVTGDGSGQAVYSSRGGELMGIVDSENVFTPLDDIKEIVTDYIKETEGYTPSSLQPVYGELGSFTGLIIEE